MRTLTLHTADELVERWRRKAMGYDLAAEHAIPTSVGRVMAEESRAIAQAYRVCASELLAILAASMEMEAAHHGDPEPLVTVGTSPIRWNPQPQRCAHGGTADEDCSACIADELADTDPNALREWLAGERP